MDRETKDVFLNLVNKNISLKKDNIIKYCTDVETKKVAYNSFEFIQSLTELPPDSDNKIKEDYVHFITQIINEDPYFMYLQASPDIFCKNIKTDRFLGSLTADEKKSIVKVN
jgi:hypothetical protein